MKIVTRLWLAGLFSLVVVAVIGGVLLFTTQQVKRELVKNEKAGEILNAVTAVRYLTLEYVMRHEERVQAQWQLRQASLSKLLASATELTGSEEQLITEGLRRTDQNVQALFASLVANYRDRENEKGRRAVADELEARLTGQIMNKAQSMISDALRLSERSREGLLRAQQQASIAVVVSGLAVICVIAATLLLTLRRVVHPLAKLREGAATVGAGNLDYRLDIKARDEIGDLSRAFDEMTEKLKGTTVSRDDLGKVNASLQAEVAERKRAEEGLRGLMLETQETANVLFASTTEILTATTQVAAGSTQTATAVSETTSTVEEVKQTAQISVKKAQHVSETAQRTAQISKDGKKSVEEAIAAMRHIQLQMESVTERIVYLSEQGQTIEGIITTVSDLAEQSNLLAVNAAIEAARAGEQGVGFAVVAQEVKSLAMQSKQATAQVRDILGDIRKATGAAVMAAEQGHKAVESGAKLSSEVGEVIRTLAGSIEEAAQAATQIAVSAQQQLVGMDQVALAMQSINQASSQNIASMRQTELAAQHLHEMGRKLKQQVDQYEAS